MAGRREEIVGVEVGEFGFYGVVDGHVLGGREAVSPFEVDDAIAGGPHGSVGGPKGCDKIGQPLTGCAGSDEGGVVVLLNVGPFGAEDS